MYVLTVSSVDCETLYLYYDTLHEALEVLEIHMGFEQTHSIEIRPTDMHLH